MENIVSLAQKMAADMPDSDKKKLQNIDFSSVFNGVLDSVKNMSEKDPNNPAVPDIGSILEKLMENMPKSKDGDKLEFGEFMGNMLNDIKNTNPNRFVDEDDVESNEDGGEVITQKSPNLHYNLNVKLEDLYNGKQKKISFNRKRYTVNEKSKKIETFTEKKKIIINIIPGTKDGDVITFPKEADQLPGQDPGDVIITICEDDHETFDREGDNLFIVKDLSLSELYSLDFTITHMDNRILHIVSKEEDVLHTNDGIRKIVGEGMPITGEDNDLCKSKGDLFIRFNLILPEKLTKEQISTLKEITPPINCKVENDDIEYVETLLDIVTEEDIENLDESDFDSSEEDNYETDSDSDSDASVNEEN